jgi:hypothetical protein
MSIDSSVDVDADSMEEWIFSLLGTSTRVQSAAKHNPMSPEESAYLSSLEEPVPTETASLLETDDHHEPDGPQPFCWKFSIPHNGLVLKSSILLQLSYRPLWQKPDIVLKR